MTMTPEDRFWLRVGKTEDDSCWLWLGSRKERNGGYGQLSFYGRFAYAHRVSWHLSNGPIPEGAQVLHKCDNPPCVRPDHLFLGTQADNVRDMFRKGRESTVPNLSSNEQYHLRTEDAELIRSIEYERKRTGLSKSRVIRLLVEAGIEHLRQEREHAAQQAFANRENR